MKKYNMSGVDEGAGMKEYPIVPAGTYVLQIARVQETTTAKGNEMVKVGFVIRENDTYNGQWIWDNIVFADNIMGRTKHFLHVIGEPYKEDDLEPNPSNWLDMKFLRAEIGIEQYNGKDKNVVKKYLFYDEDDQKNYEAKSKSSDIEDEAEPF